MEDLFSIVESLNALSPLGLAAGLAYIIYMQIKAQRGQNKIASNHLHPLPEMNETLKRIEENQRDQNMMLNDIRTSQEYIKARINGRK